MTEANNKLGFRAFQMTACVVNDTVVSGMHWADLSLPDNAMEWHFRSDGGQSHERWTMCGERANGAEFPLIHQLHDERVDLVAMIFHQGMERLLEFLSAV